MHPCVQRKLYVMGDILAYLIFFFSQHLMTENPPKNLKEDVLNSVTLYICTGVRRDLPGKTSGITLGY